MTKTLDQQLKEIEKQVNEIINDNLKFTSLFPNSFMHKYTNFSSIDEFFNQSGFKCETKEDFDAINEKALDKYIKDNTKFESWEDMKQQASNLYAKNKLEKAGIKVKLD